MLIVLPPSETKRAGGVDGSSLDLSLLSHPELTKLRRSVLAEVRSLGSNLATMSAALKLGPSQHFELLRNRAVRTSPTCAAIERYTGVLYDALDAASFTPAARAFADRTVVIHSALFGLLGAGDPIPAYRLSHDSRLPTLSLKTAWRQGISTEFARQRELVLDLRSEAYVDLGPIPDEIDSYYLRLVSAGPDGQKRALNHFNKKGKGEFTRAVVVAGIDHPTVDSLLGWAGRNDLRLTPGRPGELLLEVG